MRTKAPRRPAATETTGGTETTDGGEETTGETVRAGDAAAGKEVFESAGCASCHTLADAGATGTVGPNLDEAKPPAELVVDRVTNGMGAMPPFSGELSAEQINDVAAYVVNATSSKHSVRAVLAPHRAGEALLEATVPPPRRRSPRGGSMRKLISMAMVAACAAVIAPAAFAATATPFGGATVSGGILTLVSNTGDAGSTNDASGASFADTGVTTFSSISTLSTEFDVTDDDCKGGSPRFQVRVQTPSGEKNVSVYLGPSPSFTGCSTNVWIASGNLIGATDGRYDTSQVQAGTQISTYAQALALVGSYQVTGISLVVDSGWAFDDKEQTVKVRNVRVNGSTFYTGETTPPPTTGGLNPAQACRKLRTEMVLTRSAPPTGRTATARTRSGSASRRWRG